MKKWILILIGLSFITINSQGQLYSKNSFELIYRDLNNFNSELVAKRLYYPVRMDKYIEAYPYGVFSKTHNGYHLGTDISSPIPGNSDLGDTIYSIGVGRVVTTWNSLVMILHKTIYGYFIVSQYRHCQEVFVKEGEYVKELQPIGTIGNEYGLYQAHLHFEIRMDINLGEEGGYGHTDGFVDPIKFIDKYNKYAREKDEKQLNQSLDL